MKLCNVVKTAAIAILFLACGYSPAAAQAAYANQQVVAVLVDTGTCTTFAISSHTTTEVVLSTSAAYKAVWIQNLSTTANLFGSWNSVEISTLAAARKGIMFAKGDPVGADANILLPARTKFYLQTDADNATSRGTVCRMR